MMTTLEILSNEVLMQIYEYLDGYHLFQAFFNLTYRFNRLLKDHQLHLKFNSKHIRNNDIIEMKMLHTMVNYLTAVTLINDRHIRMFMSVCKESDMMYLHSLTLRQVRISREKASVVKYISNLKSLRNLRVEALGEIHELTLMIFCSNDLPELQSYECTNSEHCTMVMFTWPTQTNIESLTIECLLYSFANVLLQTPKLKYLKVILTNYGTADSITSDQPIPIMSNLLHLKMAIHFVSYNHLSHLMKCMPNLESLELSGKSFGENFDNGYKLEELFGHLKFVDLDNLECLTSASSIQTILKTFHDDKNRFWSDVTCSIQYDRAHISAFGHARLG